MRVRLLTTMAALAVVALIAPQGQAAASVCGGMAPRDLTCSVEGYVITTDNPNMIVQTSHFIGTVSAKMTSETGWSKVGCTYSLNTDPLSEQRIVNSCGITKYGTILKGQTVTIEAVASGRPGAVPPLGNWSVLYSAS